MRNNKFVIITNQRSGSNMLVSMLNSHPEIMCYGELFRVTPDWMKREGYQGALSVLDEVDPKFKDDNYRFSHPEKFVKAVFNLDRGPKLCGFKLHLHQHPEYIARLIKEQEWRIVVLQRDNKLAQYSSHKIAKATGQGIAKRGELIKRAKVEFIPNEFARFLSKENKKWDDVYEKLNKSVRQYVSVSYTDLVTKAHLKQMLAYLDVPTSFNLESQTNKRNSSNILSRFTNPDIVKKEMLALSRNAWLQEKFDK
jgi:LPS sulfotransferase NodH